MKVGILGGTFNPVHIGHLILAEEVREKSGLDKVIFVPAYLPPHKQMNQDIATAKHRYAMVKLAIKANSHFAVSDVEIKRKGPSYTIDTLRALKAFHPRDQLFFIIGSDLLKYLAEWKDLNEIIRTVKLIVAKRPGYSLADISNGIGALRNCIRTVDIRGLDISGFEIRQAIKEQTSFRYFVPDVIFDYIHKHHLYAHAH